MLNTDVTAFARRQQVISIHGLSAKKGGTTVKLCGEYLKDFFCFVAIRSTSVHGQE